MRFTKRWRWRFGFARVVRAQVRTGRPPEARETYERLRAAGYSSWASYRLLAAVYEGAVASMLLDERVYDHEAYLRQLLTLPRRPSVSLDDFPRAGQPNER